MAGETGGVRYNEGKSRVDLIPADALLELGEIYAKGAQKYAEWNWRKGFKWLSVYASMMRHAFRWACGEELDAESGQHHMAHVAWGAFTLLHFKNHNIGIDDRLGRDLAMKTLEDAHGDSKVEVGQIWRKITGHYVRITDVTDTVIYVSGYTPTGEIKRASKSRIIPNEKTLRELYVYQGYAK